MTVHPQPSCVVTVTLKLLASAGTWVLFEEIE